MFIVALVIGALVGVGAIWLRLGRGPGARFWVKQKDGFIDERFVVLFFPSLAILFLAVGMFQGVSMILDKNSTALWAATGFALIFAVIGLIGCIWGMTPLPYPRWFLPKWLRRGRSLKSDTKASGSSPVDRGNKGNGKRK